MEQSLKNLDEESIRNLCDLFRLLHKVDLSSKNAEKGSPDEMIIKRGGKKIRVKL